MKRLLAVLAILILTSPGFAADEGKGMPTKPAKCPITTMQSDCLACHTVSDRKFILKEFPVDAWRTYPPAVAMRVIGDSGYFLLTDIDSSQVASFFDYLKRHGIKKAVIEIHSPGGALFDAQRIVGLMRYWQSSGGKIETRLFGAAFSAAFYIFTAGDTRLVDEYSDLMWHEIQSGGGTFKLATPSDKEEATRVERRLQDIRNNYLATRGHLTKEEIDAKISKKEWWMSGADAIKFGFADGYVK